MDKNKIESVEIKGGKNNIEGFVKMVIKEVNIKISK